MLPFIGAIAVVTRAELPLPASAAILAGYCLIMVWPALLLVLLRSFAAERMEPLLQRIATWSESTSGSPVIPWAAGVVGVALVVDAAVRA